MNSYLYFLTSHVRLHEFCFPWELVLRFWYDLYIDKQMKKCGLGEKNAETKNITFFHSLLFSSLFSMHEYDINVTFICGFKNDQILIFHGL